jgi:hypothetical protein
MARPIIRVLMCAMELTSRVDSLDEIGVRGGLEYINRQGDMTKRILAV